MTRATSATPTPTQTQTQTTGSWAGAAGVREARSERELHRDRLIAVLGGQLTDPLAEGRLVQLAQRFGLDAVQSDIVAALWVGAFDPELRAQLAAREPYVGQITVRLMTSLFGHAPRVRLPSDAAALLWLIVQEHPLVDGSAALTIDPTVLAWLEGARELDPLLAGRVRLIEPDLEMEDWPLLRIERELRQCLQRGQPCRLFIDSADPLAARAFAASIGARIGLPVLELPAGVLADAASDEAAVRLQRQAFLDACTPLLALGDAALSQPVTVQPFPLQIVHGSGALTPPLGGGRDVVCSLPRPSSEQREALWRRAWPPCTAWPAQSLSDLALCVEASATEIGWAAAAQPQDAREAARLLCERGREELGTLARRIETSFEWSDLVLPEPSHERLRDIAFEARERSRVWADPRAARLFPYGRGLVALLAGAPGTGKTMAAQVIAADLGLDLLVVDLSVVVSKWVGETSQHLQKLLSSRAAQRAVLFFDEADALYAKRVEEIRDAQDRFANLDSSHLMTALESYPGIVLMATNLRANIDSAFMRRIRHVIDFPRPDAQAREHIWRKVVHALFSDAQAREMEPWLPRIARIDATGALIKNAALSALFAARRHGRAPDVRLLGEMLARELSKEGTGLSLRELERLLDEGVPA